MSGGLAKHLANLIRLQGPIPVSVYMAECLGNPNHGYYMHRDPFGSQGDFTTGPEISQMFGEMVGLWCAAVWQTMGQPNPVILAELGPGRGTLMADALRAAAALPDFRAALRPHLVETSPALRQRQQETLGRAGAVAAQWHESFDGVPSGPLIVIANEFFDALPIRQFLRGEDGWHERLVDLDPENQTGFRFVASDGPVSIAGRLADAVAAAPKGSIAEVCPAGQAIVADMAARISAAGGGALIIDYGTAASAAGDSLQAVRNHSYHPVLEDPGSADLTAHVDFSALARSAAGQGAAAYGPLRQGDFLTGLGIETRAARLKIHADARQRQEIETAKHRLTARDAMGSLFKVLALTHPALPIPPCFETPR